MTSSAKAKGDRAEREVEHLLADLLGAPLRIRRKLGAGRADDAGDIDGLPDVVVQVKSYVDIARAVREALDELPRQTAHAGASIGVGFIRRPGGRYLVVMEPETFAYLYREAIA
jgi:hypothetical protein